MAQVDYCLKIEGIEGDSASMKGAIDVNSFSWGESNQAMAGQGAGKVQMQDAHFTMPINKASVKIAEFCAKGTPITKAVLTCRRGPGNPPLEFLKYTFEQGFVSSYQTSGSDGSILPNDSFSLNFGKVEIAYQEGDKNNRGKGWISMKYNVKEGK